MSWKQRIESIAIGYSQVVYGGKRYAVTRADFNNGKSIKVYAEELGGKHFISFNYYITNSARILKPCEMPEQAVIHFLENIVTI